MIVAFSEGTDDSDVYPNGIRGVIADVLPGTRTVRQDEPLDLDGCRVLFWWGHRRHREVSPETVAHIVHHVTERGMAFVALHSSHFSEPFLALLGCTGRLASWREARERERLWIVAPDHPLARNLPNPIDIDCEEMYAEPFQVPPPDQLVMVSWFEGGEVFRSCAVWQKGQGRVVYFRPGHEAYRTFHHPHVQQFLRNAADWLA